MLAMEIEMHAGTFWIYFVHFVVLDNIYVYYNISSLSSLSSLKSLKIYQKRDSIYVILLNRAGTLPH